MSKQGLMSAAITAASIATALAKEGDWASADEHWSVSDNKKSLHLAGEIRQIKDGNLQITLQLRSGDQDWTVILPPSVQLEQHEWLGRALNVGQHISLFGYSHHCGAYELWVERIVVGDRTFELI
jgi:hypothetical protein